MQVTASVSETITSAGQSAKDAFLGGPHQERKVWPRLNLWRFGDATMLRAIPRKSLYVYPIAALVAVSFLFYLLLSYSVKAKNQASASGTEISTVKPE